MSKIAIIGGGVSGASCARSLVDGGHDVTVFEAQATSGGLVRCTIENGHLFHRVGGHVFNSKKANVSEWFWSQFDQREEFHFAQRNAAISIDGGFVGYPIENHLYQLNEQTAKAVVEELLCLSVGESKLEAISFHDFLLGRFGQTLCERYFLPYNSKIWNLDLREMPVSWLDGKLPMPTVPDIIAANIARTEEIGMVHARFYYPKKGGSQFLIERLLEGVLVKNNSRITSITTRTGLLIDGDHFDGMIYTGDIRLLPEMLIDEEFELDVKSLKSNGTTTLLCECDANPYSWIYIPDPEIRCHRMIMTGNFSAGNNSPALESGRISCTVEFVGEVSYQEIENVLRQLPLNAKMVASNYEANSYVIQDLRTRPLIAEIKDILLKRNIWLCGRFAEWEYFNMDAAIESALQVTADINARLMR